MAQISTSIAGGSLMVKTPTTKAHINNPRGLGTLPFQTGTSAHSTTPTLGVNHA